jgi:hypothetical protein
MKSQYIVPIEVKMRIAAMHAGETPGSYFGGKIKPALKSFRRTRRHAAI